MDIWEANKQRKRNKNNKRRRINNKRHSTKKQISLLWKEKLYNN